MRKITKCAIAGCAALAIAGGGVGAGMAFAAPVAPRIPTSCVAPLGNGSYKAVADGDAGLYGGDVYVCSKGSWILDLDYGQ